MIEVTITSPFGAPALAGPEDFVGKPLTKTLVEVAKAACAALEAHAERLREYHEDYFAEGSIKRYYGRSLEAMQRASAIRQLFAGNGYPIPL